MTTVPLRRLVASVDNGVWGAEAGEREVDVRCIRAADFDFEHLVATVDTAPLRGIDVRSFCRLALGRGDLVLEKSGGGDLSPVGRAVLFDSDVPAVTSNFAARLRPAQGVGPRFLNYLLASLYFSGATKRCIKQTTGIQNLDTSAWLQTPVTPATPTVQRRIADFLDERVALIDQIIAAREAQRALMEASFRSELERSLVQTGARTRPLKSLLVDVTSGPRGWGDLVGDVGDPFVRITNLRPLGIEVNDGDLRRVEPPMGSESQRAQLRPGDVLLSITAVFGEVAVWRSGVGAFSQHVARIRPIDPADSDWIAWSLQSRSLHDQYSLVGYGGTKVGMGLDQVKNLQVLDVSPAERHASAAAVTRLWEVHKGGVDAVDRSVELLKEFKQSLITAAVTGEFDVTTASTRIPGES